MSEHMRVGLGSGLRTRTRTRTGAEAKAKAKAEAKEEEAEAEATTGLAQDDRGGPGLKRGAERCAVIIVSRATADAPLPSVEAAGRTSARGAGGGLGAGPHTSAGYLCPTVGPDTLEVIRCRGYEPGACEPRKPDGSAQLRLPFGAWIVDLRPAHELATG